MVIIAARFGPIEVRWCMGVCGVMCTFSAILLYMYAGGVPYGNE